MQQNQRYRLFLFRTFFFLVKTWCQHYFSFIRLNTAPSGATKGCKQTCVELPFHVGLNIKNVLKSIISCFILPAPVVWSPFLNMLGFTDTLLHDDPVTWSWVYWQRPDSKSQLAMEGSKVGSVEQMYGFTFVALALVLKIYHQDSHDICYGYLLSPEDGSFSFVTPSGFPSGATIGSTFSLSSVQRKYHHLKAT